jgi:hypothetical protein
MKYRLYGYPVNDMMRAKYNPLRKINPLDKTGDRAEVPTAVAEFQVDLLPSKEFANNFSTFSSRSQRGF